MICRECRWETEQRRFHGQSIRVLKGHGHDGCAGDSCACEHGGQGEALEIPEVTFYGEELQRAVDGQ